MKNKKEDIKKILVPEDLHQKMIKIKNQINLLINEIKN